MPTLSAKIHHLRKRSIQHIASARCGIRGVVNPDQNKTPCDMIAITTTRNGIALVSDNWDLVTCKNCKFGVQDAGMVDAEEV